VGRMKRASRVGVKVTAIPAMDNSNNHQDHQVIIIRIIVVIILTQQQQQQQVSSRMHLPSEEGLIIIVTILTRIVKTRS